MASAGYVTFLVFATLLILVPGPDFAVVVRNTLAGGRARGLWCALGVATSNAVQGTAAAAGLGAVVLRVEPLFQAIRWAGITYLVFLAVQALRWAVRGEYLQPDAGGQPSRAAAWIGWRQGFLSNITNPKVLVFYLAVLPQFLSPGAGLGLLIGYALSHAVLGVGYSVALVLLLARARRLMARRAVRRRLDAVTGVVLLGFGARLALERS
ncbi:MAG: lysine exporter LysE/YggA [Modestobacter sp.]|nr:lysine exporter LysE/YggA [Modestobacter sp.]